MWEAIEDWAESSAPWYTYRGIRGVVARWVGCTAHGCVPIAASVVIAEKNPEASTPGRRTPHVPSRPKPRNRHRSHQCQSPGSTGRDALRRDLIVHLRIRGCIASRRLRIKNGQAPR